MRSGLLAACLLLPGTALAQQIGKADVFAVDGVVVSWTDVATCPYRLIGPISVAATEDYDGPNNRAKIFDKFSREAKKVGANGVVQIERGGSHMTAWAWSRREYTAKAVQFVDAGCPLKPAE